jgi:phosphopantetheinyl transferase
MTTALQHSGQIGQHFECVATCDELRTLPALTAEDWLHPLERVELARLRDARRREAWLFGRWVAKQLVQQALGFGARDLASIAVTSRNESGESVRPAIAVDDEILPWSLSITHGERLVAAFLETEPGAAIGIDVVQRQPLSASFQEAWLTANERQWASAAGADAACIIWGAKEAVYKAYNNGERFAPRKIEIVPDASGRLTARYGGNDLHCEIESRVFADDIIVIVQHARVNQ